MSSAVAATADLRRHAQRAVDWLLRSGVQAGTGGFAAWYDTETHSTPYLYAEITGYLTTLLCQLGDDRCTAGATAAGDWLLRLAAAENGLFQCLVPLRPSRFDVKQNRVYAFDTGVIVNGLANLARLTNDDRYRAAASRAAEWLIGVAQRPDGAFRAAYDLTTERFRTEPDEWSLRPGGYHTKVAAGLTNLYDLTGATVYRDAAIRACDAALRWQRPDGAFEVMPGSVHAHPHAYAAEGLWAVGRMLGRDDYLAASARATTWLLSRQNEDGYVPRFVRGGVPAYVERIDVQAQALRLGRLHPAEVAPAGLAQLTSIVLAHQASSPDPRVDGGVWFGRLSDGTRVPHVNVWASAFTVQALGLTQGGLDPRWLV